MKDLGLGSGFLDSGISPSAESNENQEKERSGDIHDQFCKGHRKEVMIVWGAQLVEF